MGYSLQTLSGFETFIQNQGFDNNTTNEITTYLQGLGYTSQVAQDIEPGSTPTFSSKAQVDIAVSTTVTFTPTPAPGSNTAVLIDIDDANIIVSGTSSHPVNVAVATNSGINNTVTLNDYGNDKVFLGSGGNNTVSTGFGNDTVNDGVTGDAYVNLRYSGSDSINLSSNSGNDTVVDSGSGNDTIDLGSGLSTVDASSQTGGSLDINTSTGSASITLGSSGHDTVNVATDGGAGYAGVSDSITASGSDTVTFDSSIAPASILTVGPYSDSVGSSANTTDYVYYGGSMDPVYDSAGSLTGYVPTSGNAPTEVVSVTATPGSSVVLQFLGDTPPTTIKV